MMDEISKEKTVSKVIEETEDSEEYFTTPAISIISSLA